MRTEGSDAAEYRDGVLTVTIPVAEQTKPRRIEIGRPTDTGTALAVGHPTASGQTAASDQDAASDRLVATAT